MAPLYYPLSIEGIEDVEDYQPGGFHPVHLGEVYDERYTVLLKLGAGGYSTTWLARDTTIARYVALKIVKASETTNCVELQTQQSLSSTQSNHPGRAHIRGLLAHFTITGPNGNHVCLVSEVAGPTLTDLYDARESHYTRRLRAGVARKISKQVAQAVGFLHSSGIGHGGKELVLKPHTCQGLTILQT
jgi:serine/threonine protein kinase